MKDKNRNEEVIEDVYVVKITGPGLQFEKEIDPCKVGEIIKICLDEDY